MSYSSTIKVAVVAVAKNEDYYLEEWLDYHHKLGFDKIILIQNDWRTLVERPFLEKQVCDGSSIQVPVYNEFLKHNKEFDWVAFIDLDEFIVLKKHNNIKDLIEEYKDGANAIALNWYIFGNQGIYNRQTNSLLKTFAKRSSTPDKHIKVIVNAKSKVKMRLPHNTDTEAIDTNRKIFKGPFNEDGPMDVAYINHYYQKTKEDWFIKCKRGRADCDYEYDLYKWEEHKGINMDEDDLTAHNFMYGN